MSDRIEQAARSLAHLRLRRHGARPPIDDLPAEIRPRDLEEAYAVQDHLTPLLAADLGPPAGWKIGCTAEVMQAYIGIDHPAAGRMRGNEIRRGAAELNHAALRRPGLECEIAVRLSRDLRPGEDPASAVAAAMTSIEIVEERFTDFRIASREAMIADDFFTCGCVLGEARPCEDPARLKTLRGGFTINGVEAPKGVGAAVMGDPLAALAWLARTRPLKAGEIVTLGSVVKTIYPASGDKVEARFDGLPPAVVTFI